MRLYARLLGISLRAQIQYRASFLVQIFASLVLNGVEFAGIVALFSRFSGIHGWALREVALLYGLVNASFALAESFSRGFDAFADLLKAGDFDRVLLRPRPAFSQIAAQELRLRPFGRFLQGAAVLAWAAAFVSWTPERIALAAASVAGAFFLFYALIVLQATMAFWTVDSLEMMNALTYGGVYAGSYPMEIYTPVFRRFFTFAVPLACVTWFPALAILGRPVPPAVARLSPLAGPAFLGAALLAWKCGVRKYASTGS